MVPKRLQMEGMSINFDGVKALNNAGFELEPGEIHALLGINGAGKSTLIKILSGVYSRDSGEIVKDGVPINISNPQDAIDRGIATVYQDPQVVPSFTGYENIFLGRESEGKGPFALISKAKLHKKAEKIIAKFPVEIDLTKPMEELGPLEHEIIAILRAISQDMSILILDEPTSILTETETKILFTLMKSLKKQKISIIFITHRLEEVFQICDRITIFRGGRNVATINVEEGQADPMKVADLMLGRKMGNIFPQKVPVHPSDPFFIADNLSLNGRFQDISFKVAKGEIFGIFGLVGSGTDELAKVIFGLAAPTKGKIYLQGHDLKIKSVIDAIKNKIFLVPGDRRSEGQIPLQSISFNITLANLKRISNFLGIIKTLREKKYVQKLIDQLNVVPPDMHRKVSLLSGGNQQKVVISKGLFTEADVYLFVEPSAGVDVGATADIYELIRDLSKNAAVIIISSDCKEVYGLCDHAMVMYKGQIMMSKKVEEVQLEEMLLFGVKGNE